MASAAKEYRYAHREFSTQGNLARDLDWAVRERELNHAGEALRHEAQAAPKIRREQAMAIPSFSLFIRPHLPAGSCVPMYVSFQGR